MAGHGFSIVLAPIWQEWDERVFRMVQRLHRRLPPSIPPATLHGRQLDPTDEGFGAQYQLTMNGAFSGGRHTAAYFVIQVRPLRQAPPIPQQERDAVARLVWRVDTLRVLQPSRPNAPVEQSDQQTYEVPIAEHARFEALFAAPILDAATTFVRETLASIAPSD